MEELRPTILERIERQRAEEAEMIERRKAAGDPDPWGGEAPLNTIYELEERRYLDEELTPTQQAELQLLARLYPEASRK